VGFFGFIVNEPDSVRAANTWHVGMGPGNDTMFIQDAIDNFASDGDTVFVHNGTYTEPYAIEVTKTINLIGEGHGRTIIPSDGKGTIIYVRKDWANVSGFTFINASNGIMLDQVQNCNIFNNTVLETKIGISIGYSKNNIIYGNTIINSSQFGIHVANSDLGGNTIKGNDISDCDIGIKIQSDSDKNNITYNNISNSRWGLDVDGSNLCIIYYNNIYFSKEIGIRIAGSFKITIVGNTMIDNGIWFQGGVIYWPTHYIDTTNTVNGKPVQYFKNHTGGKVPQGAGQVILANCTNMSVEGQELTNGTAGIILGLSSNNSIIGNNVSSNSYSGVHLQSSNGNNISGNIIIENKAPFTFSALGIFNSNGNNIFNNLISSNVEGGIIIRESIANQIMGNTINNNDFGVGFTVNANDNIFIDNLIFNNNYNVWLGILSRNNQFINCTLSNPGTYDFNLGMDSYAMLLNTTFNKSRVYHGSNLSSLIVRWYMHVNVIYANGSPVNNAHIWVNDTYGVSIVNESSDSEGWIRWIIAHEYTEMDLDGDNIGDRFYSTAHNVTATDGNLWGYAEPNMTNSKVVRIILGEPLPILPPTNLITRVVNNGNNVELDWDPPPSPTLDHYLIYRADSATNFDFKVPYSNSTTWPNPTKTSWIDPDPGVTTVDDDFYYTIRAANSDESDISSTSNTAGVWTRTFQPRISTFSLPLEPFEKTDTEFYTQDMNASYIRWMNKTTHTWIQHDIGDSQNNAIVEVGEGYEIAFLGTSIPTRYTFTGLPGAMIMYDDEIVFSGFDPATEAKSLTASVEPNGDVILTWQEPTSMVAGDYYEVYYSNTRDGFFGTLGIDYFLACPSINFGTNSTTITGLGAKNPGSRLYFMVVPFNSLGIIGASTYSIGIWTEEYLSGYDTIGIPLKLNIYQTTDWYCDNIPDTAGINFYIYSQQRWSWHATRMPSGAFDPVMEMADGYQISTSDPTRFTFIGI
jgi:parallel beta-helix repeat protein